MKTLFQNKYRIKSIRLKNWDYSSNGAYFITICTNDRICYFGEIKNWKLVLSNIGKIVNEYWFKIPNHHENIILDQFITMPNHIHGILFIDRPFVETCPGMSLRKYNKFSKPISGSISMIINHFKSSVKRWCNNNHSANFQWQPRFYERIIRDDYELNRIREYIINNPFMWSSDKNNKKYNHTSGYNNKDINLHQSGEKK